MNKRLSIEKCALFHRSFIYALLTIALLGSNAVAVVEADEPAEKPKLQWAGQDSQGRAVTVPDSTRISVVVFVMAGQQRSLDALKQAMALIEAEQPGEQKPQVQNAQGQATVKVTLLAVVSGRDAQAKADALARSLEMPPTIIADEEYEASGAMNVHVWPTTVVVQPDGTEAAHIGGLTPAYAKDLTAYIEFAAGRIDQPILAQRLSEHKLVTSTTDEAANRRLRMAQGLLHRGQTEQALRELKAAHEANPGNMLITITYAEAYLAITQPDAALRLLATIEGDQVPPWRLNAARGEALAQQGQWEQAIEPLTKALQLNPAPATTHYLLARAYEKTSQPLEAARHYRAAFEHTTDGKRVLTHLKKE